MFSFQKHKKVIFSIIFLIMSLFAAIFTCSAMVYKEASTLKVHSNKTARGKTFAISSTLQLKKFRQKKKLPSLGSPFNPETWNNKTANLKKKYTILYWSKIRGHVARLQTKKEYEKDKHVWPYTYVGENCPVQCELTNNRARAKEADAFVVHSRLTDVWDFPPFEYLAPWILQNNENPVYTPAISDPRVMSKFNLLISYRLDSDFPSPIYPMPTLTKPIPFKQRLGNVLAVFSKCEVVRTEYMRQLMLYTEVHSYGSCLKNRDGLIGLYGQVNGKYVFKDYKLVLTRFYKFSLVFMNQDCDYFVDDRLYHALDTGSVPVYMGTNKIDEFLPGNLKNSIIKLTDFNSPKELGEYLNYLSQNETAYNQYLLWKTTGFGDISNTTIGRWWKPKYPLFCQVCMRLAQGGLHAGLDPDVCKPRTYLDWKLHPPYDSSSLLKSTHTEQKPIKLLYIFVFAGAVFTFLIVTKVCFTFKLFSNKKLRFIEYI
ncbi:alpha-(1,3)-fucosyltransferase B isoform X1 [Hydra vulgaris]|uniref:alpha-(1,3)-fucosyltransferase B isoform X1 n=2 Tax=Hydra vulgaris TaxID=6087 RepID=UPI001F5E91FC|nr:alpha-(1,3)-fucosyltransferase B isoform X1 [Hydra vulgaris]